MRTPGNECPSFSITQLKHGNGLIANRVIKKGEEIFSETPWVWSAKTVDCLDSYCAQCGKSIIAVTQPAVDDVNSSSLSSCPNRTCTCGSTSCARFCSKPCLDEAESQGCLFLCPCMSCELKEELLAMDPRGHLLLALKVYAKVALSYIQQRLASGATPTASNQAQAQPQHVDVESVAASAVKGFHSEDWCHTKHAVRSGRWELLDRSLFDTLIAPAYYESHLQGPLQLFKQIFSPSNPAWQHYACAFPILSSLPSSPESLSTVPPPSPPPISSSSSSSPSSSSSSSSSSLSSSSSTTTAGTSFYSSIAQDFVSSNLFDGSFMRRTMGTFVVNNLTIFSPPCLSRPVSLSSPPPLRGSGLYSIYSKMNHSCVCNTSNSSSRTKISVFASRDIEMGEEITTTYLHARNAHALSRRKRNKQLLQYLFSCSCELCESQGEDEDSSDDENDDDEV